MEGGVGAGDDRIQAGANRDIVRAGPGDDRIQVVDRSTDTVKCGPGDDSVIAREQDELRGCETVELL